MTIVGNIKAVFNGTEFTPDFKGNQVLFKYPCTESNSTCSPIFLLLSKGHYNFELYGAQGGNSRHLNSIEINPGSGGKGAYVSGTLDLKESHFFYLFIGGKGEDASTNSDHYPMGGYNGGGNGGNENNGEEFNENSAAGGGATDIRLLPESSLNESLKSRIIVAAGGGGACSDNQTTGLTLDYRAGPGGNQTGISYNTVSIGGTQNSGFFGKGDNGLSFENQEMWGNGGSSGGGGGGYYGGYHVDAKTLTTQTPHVGAGGAGGSSFVSGCKGCNSVSYFPINEIIHSGISTHYSNFIFRNIIMKSGEETFHSPMNNNDENGHSGNGAIVITLLGSISKARKIHFIHPSFLFVCLLF